MKHWVETASDVQTNHAYLVTLPLHDAARLHALAEMYPGRTEQQNWDEGIDTLAKFLAELIEGNGP